MVEKPKTVKGTAQKIGNPRSTRNLARARPAIQRAGQGAPKTSVLTL
jgi:hypothetical protein